MGRPILKFNPHNLIIFTLLFIGAVLSDASIDDTGDVKCSSCPPCGTGNPCYQSPPPPPPPPKKPPSPKKPPPSSNCPPPPALPSPGYVYIPGPPGNLYPIDGFYSNWAGRNIPTSNFVGLGLIMVMIGFISMVRFY